MYVRVLHQTALKWQGTCFIQTNPTTSIIQIIIPSAIFSSGISGNTALLDSERFIHKINFLRVYFYYR